MVSSEGACAAYYLYRRLELVETGHALSPTAIDFDGWVCPLPLRDTPTIVMGHGGGGAMSGELIEHLFLPAFGGAADAELGDSAVRRPGRRRARLAFSTDSFVVKPLFFPGGIIGDLAVNGTVNDLAMSGATPLYLSTAFILEEGTALAEIGRVATAIGEAARGRRRPARHRRHQGRRRGAAATASSSTPPASAWSPDGVDIRPRRARASATS